MRDNAGACLAGRFAVCGVLANGLLASPAAGQCTYDVTVIQAPACPSGGHPPTIGLGLNEHSHVVGYQLPCGFGGDRAFLWTPEEGYELLPLPAEAMSMRANDISDSGTIVGTMHMFDLGDRGFVYDPATREYTILHPVFPDSGWSQAHAINDQNRVVGERSITDEVSPRNAFVWSAKTGFTDLGIPIEPGSAAVDLNEDGVVVAWSGTALFHEAFVWEEAIIMLLGPIPHGLSSNPESINNLGMIAGGGFVEKEGGLVSRAFLWENDQWTLFELLLGYDSCGASDLNDRSQVIGFCTLATTPSARRGFLWASGAIHDLNDLIVLGPDVLIERPFDINDLGQIVADGNNEEGDVVTFLLTPIDPSPADLDGDCDTDASDLLILLEAWGTHRSPADFDGNGSVGFSDLLFLLSKWS